MSSNCSKGNSSLTREIGKGAGCAVLVSVRIPKMIDGTWTSARRAEEREHGAGPS